LIDFKIGDYILKVCANIKEDKSVCSIKVMNQEHNTYNQNFQLKR